VGWALLFLIVVGAVSIALRRILDRTMPAYRTTPAKQGAQLRGEQTRAIRPEPEQTQAQALEIRGLTFGYGPDPLFSDVSFTMGSDLPLVLSGESGCGKTTLARCVANLLEPWEGSVRGPERRVLVFQHDALLDHRDALGNVLLPVLPSITPEAIDRANAALGLWGLDQSATRFPHELSGGMRKRLAMARAWFMEPQALILDEPFVNLDREARAVLWETLFTRIAEDPRPCLIITHYPEELAGFKADHVGWSELVRGARSLTAGDGMSS
jgi:NitT/TauT family transport system ATP-binding protein